MRRRQSRIVSALLMTGLLAVAVSATAAVDEITGAGATFPYPVYAKWARAYQQQTGVRLNYQAMGSGGGIKQIKAQTVDFGASDAPLEKEELDQAGLMQFPTVMGGVVPVVHIPGVASGELVLDGPTFAAIFLGQIERWDDPRISRLNPDLDLPHRRITVVHRSDGAGTTWIFTSYLARVSAAWANQVGQAKAVPWPVGIGGKGNQGVASYIGRIDYSIGYVEYSYALQNDMTHVALKNKAGQVVQPSAETFQAAAANADWQHAPGFHMVLTNQPGADSWPITGASFILMHKRPAHPATARAVLAFFAWAYAHGDRMADRLDYVPLPDKVVRLVERAWQREIRADGEPVRAVQ